MKYKKSFSKFTKELDKKMLKGFKEYGDLSFNLSPDKLIDEMIEEVIDISGWGLILWVRLQEIKKEYEKSLHKRKTK